MWGRGDPVMWRWGVAIFGHIAYVQRGNCTFFFVFCMRLEGYLDAIFGSQNCGLKHGFVRIFQKSFQNRFQKHPKKSQKTPFFTPFFKKNDPKINFFSLIISKIMEK